MGKRAKMREKVLRGWRAHKILAVWGICGVLFAGGCGGETGDFFTYAPKSHIITAESVEQVPEDSLYGEESAEDVRNRNATEAHTEEVGPEGREPLTETAKQDPAERLVGNVEYDDDMESGIIREMPFVYKGVRFSYDGDPEVDFAVAEQTSGRKVESTAGRNPSGQGDAALNAQNTGDAAGSGEDEEPPLYMGTVGFNGNYDEGHLVFHGEFPADITIAYSEAGPLQTGTVEVPVFVENDEEGEWQVPVSVSLCGAVSGKNGRVYALVRNRDGGLDLLQYSYEYVDSSGKRNYIRLIASFYGGASEGQAVGLLDRFDFKYVGDNIRN